MKYVLSFAAVLHLAGGSAVASESDIKALSFLTGCWQSTQKASYVEERWDAPGGGLMLGTSKTVVHGSVRQYEFLRIEERRNGDIVYTPFLNGSELSSFTLTWIQRESNIASFENPENDFPKRITYWRTEQGLFVTLWSPEKSYSYTLESKDCIL